jgi:hypothetical protein
MKILHCRSLTEAWQRYISAGNVNEKNTLPTSKGKMQRFQFILFFTLLALVFAVSAMPRDYDDDDYYPSGPYEGYGPGGYGPGGYGPGGYGPGGKKKV